MNFEQVVIFCAFFLAYFVENINTYPELTTKPQTLEVNTRRFMRPRRNYTLSGIRTSSSIRGPDNKLSPVSHHFDSSLPAIGQVNRVETRMSPGTSKRQTASPESSIYFPGDTAKKMPLKILKPNCTETYCTEIPDYPLNVLSRIDLDKFLPLFKDDLEENVVQTRLNAPEEESLCDSISTKIYPRQGWNMENQMLFIINHDRYRQGILVEECTSTNNPCKYAAAFPLNKRSKCKQKYVYRHLQVERSNEMAGPSGGHSSSESSIKYLPERHYITQS